MSLKCSSQNGNATLNKYSSWLIGMIPKKLLINVRTTCSSASSFCSSGFNREKSALTPFADKSGYSMRVFEFSNTLSSADKSRLFLQGIIREVANVDLHAHGLLMLESQAYSLINQLIGCSVSSASIACKKITSARGLSSTLLSRGFNCFSNS